MKYVPTRWTQTDDFHVWRWRIEKWTWAAMLPIAVYTRWLYAVAFVSAVSIYTAYQTASANEEAIKVRIETKRGS